MFLYLDELFPGEHLTSCNGALRTYMHWIYGGSVVSFIAQSSSGTLNAAHSEYGELFKLYTQSQKLEGPAFQDTRR